jgi:hypothetical protein
MVSKVTRRAVLGTIVGGLAVSPFVIRHLRKNRVIDLLWELDPRYKQFVEGLSFPRTFDPDMKFGSFQNQDVYDWGPAPPVEVRDKIFAVQKCLWQNYSKLDELKFVLSSSYYCDGELVPSSHRFYHAEVWFKLGYGVEIKGKNTLGKDVHLVLNIDGEDNQPDDEHRVNLRNYSHSIFESAFPQYAKGYKTFEENVILPNSFRRTYTEPLYPSGLPDHFFEMPPKELYTQLTGSADNVLPPWHVFRNRYFSQETGMPELCIVESDHEDFEVCSPLYETHTYQKINGIHFPLEHNGGKIDGWHQWRRTGDRGFLKVYAWKEEYSDVQVKFIL